MHNPVLLHLAVLLEKHLDWSSGENVDEDHCSFRNRQSCRRSHVGACGYMGTTTWWSVKGRTRSC